MDFLKHGFKVDQMFLFQTGVKITYLYELTWLDLQADASMSQPHLQR